MPATLNHAELVAAINPNRDRLADLLRDAARDYDQLLEKLDTHAGWIAKKMERLRASIACSRETDPSTLSVNPSANSKDRAPNWTGSAAKSHPSDSLYAASAKSSR